MPLTKAMPQNSSMIVASWRACIGIRYYASTQSHQPWATCQARSHALGRLDKASRRRLDNAHSQLLLGFVDRRRHYYSQRIFFNLHIPHAPRLRDFHLLLVMEAGAPETVWVMDGSCTGEDAGTGSIIHLPEKGYGRHALKPFLGGGVWFPDGGCKLGL